MKEGKRQSVPRVLTLPFASEALALLRKIGVDPYGIDAMLPKMKHHNILLEHVECRVANIIKQEMLSLGGDAAVARGSVECSIPETDAVIMGTGKQIRRFLEKIADQPFGLDRIGKDVGRLLDNIESVFLPFKTCRRNVVIGDRTWIMGILNVTPDSFSDGGAFRTPEEAVERGIQMAAEGADIIDVGGESSRPGAKPVPLHEELARVIPVIEGLSREVAAAISVDTTKADCAEAAVIAGAEIINDISAMRWDRRMTEVAASSGAGVILMHMRGTPSDMQTGDLSYRSLIGEISDFLKQRMEEARDGGVDPEHVMVDPGLGFGKTGVDNLKLIKHLAEFKALGRPIIVGPSRKSFVGSVTGGGPKDRFEGTAAAVSAAVMMGAHVVRVHDVAAMKKVVNLIDEIKRA